MPKDLAPLVRNIAIIAVVVLVVPFALLMKGGAFKGESVALVLVCAALLAGLGMSVFSAIDNTRDAKLPNPLHPDNRPTEPPSV